MQRQVVMRMGFASRRMFSSATGSSAASTATSSATSGDKKKEKLRIVVAVGGNALQRRGDRLTIENMLKAAAEMAPTMASLAKEHELGKEEILKSTILAKFL